MQALPVALYHDCYRRHGEERNCALGLTMLEFRVRGKNSLERLGGPAA